MEYSEAWQCPSNTSGKQHIEYSTLHLGYLVDRKHIVLKLHIENHGEKKRNPKRCEGKEGGFPILNQNKLTRQLYMFDDVEIVSEQSTK